MTKKTVVRLAILGFGLAIAEKAPEIIAQRIRVTVNREPFAVRLLIAWRIILAKL